jgi:AAA domain
MTIRLVYPEVQADADHDDEAPRPNVNVIEPHFRFGDPALLPRRKFIYGKHYLRGAVSMTAADGGVGKSTLAICEGVAMALGRNLLGVPVPEPQEVVYINLESLRRYCGGSTPSASATASIPKSLRGGSFISPGLTIRWSPRRWNVARSCPVTCRTPLAYWATMS